jgi:hypothetical protein
MNIHHAARIARRGFDYLRPNRQGRFYVRAVLTQIEGIIYG